MEILQGTLWGEVLKKHGWLSQMEKSDMPYLWSEKQDNITENDQRKSAESA